MPSLKPDYACALQRKTRTVASFAAEQCVLSGPGCRANIAKNGHVSRISERGAAEFLCSPDCVAEGEGFEPPVRFPVQWFSRCTVLPRPHSFSSTYSRIRSLQVGLRASHSAIIVLRFVLQESLLHLQKRSACV